MRLSVSEYDCGLGRMREGIFAKFIAFFAGTSLYSAHANAQTMELVHFWQSPAEQAALEVFEKSFEARGGTWYGTARANQTKLKSYAIDRISTGNAPAAMQWHGGPEIEQLLELSIAEPLENISDNFSAETLYPSVAKAITFDEKISALPVGIHGENWAWRNLEIYRELDLPEPTNWEEFLEQAKLIRDAGYVPLATSGATWELTIIFNSIVLSTGGIDFYLRLLKRDLDAETDRKTLKQIITTFQRVRNEAAPRTDGIEGWLDATQRVIEGKAAIQLMGDWAKGEFLQAGKRLGTEFDCSLSFNGGIMTMVLDVFVLPPAGDDAARELQGKLIETVLDPKNQQEFSLLKGSLPVVADVDEDEFDECAQEGLKALETPSKNAPALLLALPQDGGTKIGIAISKIWKKENLSAEKATDKFLSLLEAE